ncbi:unnamed protein product, partial [Ilex paraguariensis]
GRNLEEEISKCVEDEDCFEDIQDIYDQLYIQFLKQQENVFSLSDHVNSSEEETTKLQMDLVKSKIQICGIKDENKALPDR